MVCGGSRSVVAVCRGGSSRCVIVAAGCSRGGTGPVSPHIAVQVVLSGSGKPRKRGKSSFSTGFSALDASRLFVFIAISGREQHLAGAREM